MVKLFPREVPRVLNLFLAEGLAEDAAKGLPEENPEGCPQSTPEGTD